MFSKLFNLMNISYVEKHELINICKQKTSKENFIKIILLSR